MTIPEKMCNFIHDFHEGLVRSHTSAPFPRASIIPVTGQFSFVELSQDVIMLVVFPIFSPTPRAKYLRYDAMYLLHLTKYNQQLYVGIPSRLFQFSPYEFYFSVKFDR